MNCEVLKFAEDTPNLCHAKNEAKLRLIAEDTLSKTDQYETKQVNIESGKTGVNCVQKRKIAHH